MEPYIGTIMLFAFPRIPTGWAACDGSLLPIAEYDTLFSLIGTTYGGDGIQTFALPDLRGRVPIHQGTGPGLTPRVIGEVGGTEMVTILPTSMPSHGHALTASSSNPPAGGTATPGPNVGFGVGVGISPYATSISGGVSELMAPSTITGVGGNQPHDNMMPTLVGSYCIALYGIYPTQS